MSEEFIIELLALTLQTAGLLAAPVLITAVVVGILTNILQTITQVRESAVSFVPKLVASAVVLCLAAPWCLQVMRGFFAQVIEIFGRTVS
jgi:flagellar biosynthetic protein FliQ